MLELAAMESKVWVDGAGVGWCWSSHKVRGQGRQYTSPLYTCSDEIF